MICSSMSYPSMFDLARGRVSMYNEAKSIVNRVKLLLLSEPTELYMNPNFGVGLKKYMFTLNNDNTVALIRDELVDQLALWEPGVIAEKTKVTRGLEYTGGVNTVNGMQDNDKNHLKLTITLTTSYMKEISFSIDGSDF